MSELVKLLPEHVFEVLMICWAIPTSLLLTAGYVVGYCIKIYVAATYEDGEGTNNS